MPSDALKSLAKKSEKSLADLERYWKEAKNDVPSDVDDKYAYIMGIVKKRAGLSEEVMKMFTAEQWEEFFESLNEAYVPTPLQDIVDREKAEGTVRNTYVGYARNPNTMSAEVLTKWASPAHFRYDNDPGWNMVAHAPLDVLRDIHPTAKILESGEYDKGDPVAALKCPNCGNKNGDKMTAWSEVPDGIKCLVCGFGAPASAFDTGLTVEGVTDIYWKAAENNGEWRIVLAGSEGEAVQKYKALGPWVGGAVIADPATTADIVDAKEWGDEIIGESVLNEALFKCPKCGNTEGIILWHANPNYQECPACGNVDYIKAFELAAQNESKLNEGFENWFEENQDSLWLEYKNYELETKQMGVSFPLTFEQWASQTYDEMGITESFDDKDTNWYIVDFGGNIMQGPFAAEEDARNVIIRDFGDDGSFDVEKITMRFVENISEGSGQGLVRVSSSQEEMLIAAFNFAKDKPGATTGGRQYFNTDNKDLFDWLTSLLAGHGNPGAIQLSHGGKIYFTYSGTAGLPVNAVVMNEGDLSIDVDDIEPSGVARALAKKIDRLMKKEPLNFDDAFARVTRDRVKKGELKVKVRNALRQLTNETQFATGPAGAYAPGTPMMDVDTGQTGKIMSSDYNKYLIWWEDGSKEYVDKNGFRSGQFKVIKEAIQDPTIINMTADFERDVKRLVGTMGLPFEISSEQAGRSMIISNYDDPKALWVNGWTKKEGGYYYELKQGSPYTGRVLARTSGDELNVPSVSDYQQFLRKVLDIIKRYA